jgi:predicted branched-subunit amino acid permease
MADTAKMSGRPHYLMALQMTAWLAWFGGSVAGAVFGSLIDSVSFGIPFAMTALFICLLVLQIKSRAHLAVAVVGGALALFFKGFLPNNLYIVAAAIAAPLAGLWLLKRRATVKVPPAEVEAEI